MGSIVLLDLFECQYNGVEAVLKDYFERPYVASRMRVFRNQGDGTFSDVSEEVGLDRARSPMGANYGDIDNDGWLDVYLGTGGPPFEHLAPNVLLRNINGHEFRDVTASARVGHLQKGHGIAFGDYDGDGDQDFYAQLGGFSPDDKFHDALFRNPGNSNHWITMRLVGKETNRPAIGARVEVVIEEGGAKRSLHRVVHSGGSFGANSLQLEVGLGAADEIAKIIVKWPVSTTTQTIENVGVNQRIEIVEGETDYRKL
ncbi:MAG: CRTAC1 family protein [Planctomycetota bacterium]